MTKIKICGITRLQDALSAVEAGAHAIGLVFYPNSPRHVSSEQASEIIQELPPFISTVGLFVNPTVDQVWQVLDQVALSCLQFHGEETDVFCQQFARPYLKAVRVRPDSDIVSMMAAYPKSTGILLDAYQPGMSGGTGQVFDWHQIPAQRSKPIILAGGLSASNVAAAIAIAHPYAVDVSSGVEDSPGLKNRDKMKQFCQQVYQDVNN